MDGLTSRWVTKNNVSRGCAAEMPISLRNRLSAALR